MIERLPEPFQSRLGRLAAEVAVGRRATATEQAIELACDLISAEVAPEAVVDVAALSPKETWREAGSVVLAMLATVGIPIPDASDKAAEWGLLQRAFGFWELPVADFYGPFLHRLPAWDEQSPMERSITRLLDELDHETTPEGRAAVVERVRAAVRDALA